MARRNINQATAVGATAGAVATPAIAWGSAILEAKYQVPSAVTMPLLGSLAGLFMRWAAKLDPHE